MKKIGIFEVAKQQEISRDCHGCRQAAQKFFLERKVLQQTAESEVPQDGEEEKQPVKVVEPAVEDKAGYEQIESACCSMVPSGEEKISGKNTRQKKQQKYV